MLKFPVFKLLNEIIGEYLVNFSKDQLTLQFTDKTMSFSNLILNPKKVNEKFDSLDLFCHLKSGMIKDLKIEVISIVESKDIKVYLKELFLILGPNLSFLKKNESKSDFHKELENLQKKAKEPKNNKFSLLKSFFLEKVLLKGSKKREFPKRDKFTATETDKMIFDVLKNIKLTIQDFHLRYEDDQITNPISFGLLAREIQIFNSEKNTLEAFNRKSQFVYMNLEAKANPKLGKSKNLIMKTFELTQIMCYFNTKSELYIPFSLYENTKNSKKGIFEAINYFDLQCWMKMYFNQKDQKFVLKLFETQGKVQLDLTLFSDEQIINLEENTYLINLVSETIAVKIQKEALQEMAHLLDFIKSYSLLEILAYFKPAIRPLINCPDKTLRRAIAREWFELAIWFNRLIAYRDAQKLDLIENSLLVSAHINNLTKRPNIMNLVNKLIDSPWHMAFHFSLMYLRLEILEDWEKILEIQIQEPVFDLAINQNPNTLNLFVKTESLQMISLDPVLVEFEPERYEAPFIIPSFDANIHQKKKIFEDSSSKYDQKEIKNPKASVISLRNGFNITFMSSGLDIDGKTMDIKINLKPIEINLKQSGVLKILTILKSFLSIPYLTRKRPVSFLEKRIIKIRESLKNPDNQVPNKKKNPEEQTTLQGFEKIDLEDINNEKIIQKNLEKSVFLDQEYTKYDLKKNETKKKKILNESDNWLQKGRIIYEEINNLKAKALKRRKKEKILDFKDNLKRLGVFAIVDYKDIDFKLERASKSLPIVTHFSVPEGKITGAFNQVQSEMNYLNLNGIKIELSKDLDYLFDFLVKMI